MATKYWVGGTGTWDGFTATNWSDTSGGSGGAIAPCALDDVVFNSASNATGYTVTINSGAVCRDLTIAGPASGNVTVAGSGTLGVFGSLTLPATGITRTYSGFITFRATTTGKTITTNGVTLASTIAFNGVGGGWTLQDALTANEIQMVNGALDTNGKTVTISGSFNTQTAGISSSITLGASTISCTFLGLQSTTTVNAGTSSITLTTTSPQLGTSIGNGFTGVTFYNVTINPAGGSQVSIFGANTFNSLTFGAAPAAQLVPITFYGNQTVTGTLTIAGSGAINRYMLLSDTIGTARTLTVGTVAALTDVDFRDITVAGASSPWSGTRLGDCGGNTNITFGAGATKYWNLPAGGAWTAAAWATTSGGTADVLNFPLAQDTAIIENTGLNTSASITGFNGFNLKTLDCSTRSNAATLSGTTCRIYDDFTLSTSMTVTGLSVLFEGRTTQTITSAGRTLGAITVNNSGSNATLADAYNGTSITLTSGTFNTANQNVTLSGSLSATANALNKTFTFGSSTISCTGFFNSSVGVTNLTINAGTSSITLTNASIGFVDLSHTYYNVTFAASAGTQIIYGANTFNNVTFTAPVTTSVTFFTLSGNQTINGTLALAGGTSVVQRMMFRSNLTGTQRTITAATVTGLTDIDFRDIQGAGAGNWTTGTRLGDCGGNSGITFPAAKTVYWNLAGTQNWSATAWATSSGGSPAANNFPLAQDTAVFDDTGAAGTVTLNSVWNIGTISAGGRTSAWTLAGSSQTSIYGDVTYGSGITASATGSYTFGKPGTQTYTTAGKSVVNGISIDNPSCVFQHGDAYNTGGVISIVRGTYNTQNYAIIADAIFSSTSNTRTITFGSSTLTLTGTSTVNFTTSTNLTFNAGTSTINMSSTGAKTFNGGGQTFNTVTSTGGTTNALTISGSNTFNTFSNTAYTYLILTSGTTQTFTNFNYTGASGSVVRISTSTPGLTATVQKPTAWYAGANSTDGGNNTGGTFTAGGSTDYVYIKDIIATISASGAGGKFFFMF